MCSIKQQTSVSFFNTFRSTTNILACVNVIRLEYRIINHFLMMFLITNPAHPCNNSNKEPPTMRQDTVQTKYTKMAPSLKLNPKCGQRNQNCEF